MRPPADSRVEDWGKRPVAALVSGRSDVPGGIATGGANDVMTRQRPFPTDCGERSHSHTVGLWTTKLCPHHEFRGFL